MVTDDFDPLEFLKYKQPPTSVEGDFTPQNPQTAAPVAPPMDFTKEIMPLLPPIVVEQPDALIAANQDKKKTLENKQAQLLQEAAATGQFSKNEKIASGLAMALPGLLGAIVGGALAGPQGALAGFGGGASGGVSGVQDLQKRKDSQAKNLTDQANQLAARIDAADQEIMRRKDRLEDRSLSKEEKEKERIQIERLTKDKLVAEEKLLDKKLGAEERLTKLSNNARRGDLLLQNAAMLEREQMDTERALLLAGEKAKSDAKKAGKENKLTESQANALMYGSLAKTSMDAINYLDNKGFDRTSVLSGVSTITPNIAKDPNIQMAVNAEKNFLAAVLRKQSGGAITDEEWSNTAPQYFERAGDSPEVVAQKRAFRQTFLNGMARSLGDDGMQMINETSAPINYNTKINTKSKKEIYGF